MGAETIKIAQRWAFYFLLPSSKLIIILENKDYMAMMKEKLAEIKGVYRSMRLAPVRI